MKDYYPVPTMPEVIITPASVHTTVTLKVTTDRPASDIANCLADGTAISSFRLERATITETKRIQVLRRKVSFEVE